LYHFLPPGEVVLPDSADSAMITSRVSRRCRDDKDNQRCFNTSCSPDDGGVPGASTTASLPHHSRDVPIANPTSNGSTNADVYSYSNSFSPSTPDADGDVYSPFTYAVSNFIA